MENISFLAQLVIALSIIIVWVFRYDNIVKEFQQYGLSDFDQKHCWRFKKLHWQPSSLWASGMTFLC